MFLSTFLGATLLAGSVGSATGADSPVTVALDTRNPGAAIPPDFSGLSFEVALVLPGPNGVHYFRPDNKPLINLFHTFGIKSLRIGGNTSDRDVRQLPDQADLDSLFGFARAAQVKVIYCLRLCHSQPQADVQTAKYIMDHYANQMDCFSIGQEPSAYPKIANSVRAEDGMGPAMEKYPYPLYASEWKKFADAIAASVPGVKFCGPSVHNNGAWAVKFIHDFAQSNRVVLVTEHLYPGGAGNKVATPEIGIDRMLSGNSGMTNGFPRVYQRLYDSFVPLAVSQGLPYRLEEVNNYFNGGAAKVSNTFASALWGLDFMHWWAAHGAAGLNFHTGDQVAAGYTLQPSKYTAYFSTTNGYLVRPLGYGIKTFDLGGRGKILPAAISNPGNLNLNAYAVLGDDKKLYLTVINQEHGADARDAIISIHPDDAGFTRGEVIFLSAPANDVAATEGETLGGAAIQSDGSWSGTWTPLASPAMPGRAGDVFQLRVPAANAAIVKLTRNLF